jgi:hypothetical protein
MVTVTKINLINETVEEVQEELPDLSSSMEVPESITPLQGLRAIDAAGLSDIYSVWANSQDRTFLERAFIDKAQTWQRNDSVLVAGASAIGLTDDQLDQLFRTASQL